MDYEEWVQTSKAYDKEIYEALERANHFKQKKADLAIGLRQEGLVSEDADILADPQKLSELRNEGKEMRMMGVFFSLLFFVNAGFMMTKEAYLVMGFSLIPAIFCVFLARSGHHKAKRALKIESF